MQKIRLPKILLRLIKYFSIFVFVIILLSSALLFAITKLYNEEIKQVALDHLNKQLNSSLEVNKIDVGFLAHFPQISITFKEINIKDQFNKSDTLFYCEKLDLNFNATDLINQKYIIRKLILNQGVLNLKINKNGDKNFLVFDQKKNINHDEFKFVLDFVSLNNVILNYENDILYQDYSFLLKKTLLKGDFSNEFYDLDISSSLIINYFKLDKLNYINRKSADINSTFKIINEPFAINIDEGSFEIAEMDFTFSGYYDFSNDDEIELSIIGDNIKVSEVFTVFPIDYFSILERYDSKGDLNFKASLKGNISQNQTLLFEADFNAENAAFKDLENNISMSNIFLNGVFNNKKKLLKISDFSARFGGEELKGDFILKDFKKPLLKLKIDGSFDLNKISFFLEENPFDISGVAMFNIESEMKWNSTSPYFKFIKGNINANEVQFGYSPLNFIAKLEELNLNFPNQDLILTASNVKVNDDIFTPKVKIEKWLDIVLKNSMTVKTDFSLDFQNLNLNNWLEYMPQNNNSTKSFYNNIFKGSISAKNLTYDKLKFNNIKFNQLNITENFQTGSVTMNGHGGAYDFKFLNSSSGKKFCEIKGLVNNIDLQKLFIEFENFDQQLITDQQLNGLMTSSFDLKLPFDSLGNIQENKIQLSTLNNFENIKLINFTFLSEILDYFKGHGLTKKIIDTDYYFERIQELDIANFQSNISINKGQIEIEPTTISSILKFNFFGSYSLNDSVDYHLNFNWRDIKKKRRNKNNYNTEDDGLGKQLFLKIYGNIDDLNYVLDKKEMKKNRKEKLSQEKEIIKKIIDEGVSNQEAEKSTPVFEVEIDQDGKKVKTDTTSKLASKKSKTKKKKDSSRLNKFLKKIGVDEEVKTKPKFEINQ